MYYICKKKQMESLHDYFFLNNRWKIKDSDIQVVLNNKDFYSEIAEAFERVCYGHAYVLNHFDDTFLYTSLHAPIWCRNSMDECRRAICKEENKLVEEASLNLSHVFERLMREEKTHAVIYSSFHIDYQNCPLMVNCRMTPLVVNGDGALVASLIVFSLPVEQGDVSTQIYLPTHEKFLNYSFKEHKWLESLMPVLTFREREILHLSAQGCTSKEIGQKLCRSIDTIKRYKKNISRKLNASTISAAIVKAASYKLL